MTPLIKLVIISVIFYVGKAEFPLDSSLSIEELVLKSTEDDPTVYRLPEDLEPISYIVEITPYFEAEGDKEAFTFDGEVTIIVKALKENLKSLIIHENVRHIRQVTVTREDGSVLELEPFKPFERLQQYHFLKINLRDETSLNINENYFIKITYIGNINETPLSRGIFRGSYQDSEGNTHWYAASHLQPTNSRQAFPSFDEPGFKSVFHIIVNRPANFGETYSNMKIDQVINMGNRVKEIFKPTPRMSAYLVTIHISEEFKVINDNGNEERSYRIIARPNAEGQGDYALKVGPPITEWLGKYFGDIDYYEMGDHDIMKNDQIAVPDWASGATENWGLVSYRELRLLYEEGETNALDKMNIGTITAHELAHKWFGNLITCRWWDNVWINEGFASYFEYFAMDGVDPDLELKDQFNIMYLQSALSVDSSANTRALQHTVNSPTEVTGHFSGISYSKGASLLLMLKHFLGEDTFKLALNRFLIDNSFEHAFPQDLYTAFSTVVGDNQLPNEIKIDSFFKLWVEEEGYPIITVNVNMESGVMNLTQERFFISASTPQTEQIWPVPLTYTTGNNPDWNDLTPRHVMTEKTKTMSKDPEHEWVIFNVQQKGIYRVNYDEHNWEMIASALNENKSSIHHLNRAQIVDDVFALMRSERLSYELGFKILKFLNIETDYYSWYPAITGFSWLRNRFLHIPDALNQFNNILYDYLDTVIKDLDYDVDASGERLTRTLNRFFVLEFACNIGHEGCVNKAIEQFETFKNNGVRVNPNIRRHVYCTALRRGNLDDFMFLYEKWQASNNQAAKVAMLRALGCTTNQQAIQLYLETLLSDQIKAQDSVNALTYLYMGDRGNANIVLQFLKEHVNAIRTKVVLPAWFNSVLSNLASYLNEEGLKDMEDWLNSNQLLVPEYTVGLNAISSTRANMEWGTQHAAEILAAARDSAVVALPATILLLITLFITIKNGL